MADVDPMRNLHSAILLKRLEYNVFVASTSPDLFRITSSIMPNLILLDVRMPLFEGHACLEKLRANPMFNYIKIVTVSDANDLDMLKKTAEHGASAYLTRPLCVTELYATIQRLTENRPRKIPRLRVIFKVTMVAGKTGRAAFATMISEKGVFVRTMHPLDIDTDVKLTLDLPSSIPLVLEGKVIYQVKYDRDQFVEPGMAILFRGLKEDTRLGLKKFIESHLKGDLEQEMVI